VNAASIDATHLESYELAPFRSPALEQPVCGLFTLHPPHHATAAMLMNHRQRHSFGAIFCDPVVVVQSDLSKIRNWR